MTAQELINTVSDNLGNRSGGTIGSRTVSTVILEGINLGLPHLVQEAQPDYYNRITTLSVVAGTREYTLPVVDDDGGTIRIKDIYDVKGYRSDGTTPHTFVHVGFKEFINRTRGIVKDTTGNPQYFALWGKTNKIYFDYVPSENMTMEMYIETYPIAVSDTQLNVALPMDDEWNLVLEAFVTAHCYLKLQQVQMYTIWNDRYIKQKASVSRSTLSKQSHNQQMGGVTSVSDPLLDPFIRRYN